MRASRILSALVLVALAATPLPALAKKRPSSALRTPKPWCAPEVQELTDHVCWFDGGPDKDGKRTLVIYLHGMLATTPGFQYLQQRGMALHAKRHRFTVLMPTSPKVDGTYLWPTGKSAQAEHEAAVVEGIHAARRRLEQKLGFRFDETFVIGFSSGAYYGSTAAIRSILDVDGYMFLAGGSSWARPTEGGGKRAPIFVGVSASDKQTAEHSRALAATLASLKWPMRVEERKVGHMVDWTFMERGLAWLRARARSERDGL